MQLNRNAYPKTLPSTRQNRRFTRFSFASFLAVTAFCCASSASANWVCTDDMTPVEVALEAYSWKNKPDAPKPVRMKLPKSYIIYPSELWHGGTYELMTIGVDVSDMSPVCKKHTWPTDPMFKGALPTPDFSHEDAVWITIEPTHMNSGTDPVDQLIKLESKTYTELLNDNDRGFKVYKNPLSPKHQIETLLIPHEGLLQNRVRLKCVTVIKKEQHAICEAYTYENGKVRYSYSFKEKKWLQAFSKLDGKIRELLNQFLESK